MPRSRCPELSRQGSSTFGGAESLDLSNVSREHLPIGVPSSAASRMRLDAEGSPALLDLRMNYRNLLNEFTLHGGRIVSHQFALMKPRRNKIWEKPEKLQVPDGCDPVLFRKVARKRAREKQRKQAMAALGESASSMVGEGAATLLPTRAQESEGAEQGSVISPLEEEEEEDEVFARPIKSRDPTAGVEVQDLMNDPRIRKTFEGLQEPPGSSSLPLARTGRALEALGFRDPDEAAIQRALASLMRREDDGGPLTHLMLAEFCVLVHCVSTKRQEVLRGMFARVDRDDSGTITHREFRHMLWDLGFNVGESTMDEIFHEVDADRSGNIELDEFEEALRVIHERHGFTRREADTLLAIFDRYDTDNSGEMSAPELASAMGWFGVPMTITQAEDLINRFDQDSDASLCRCEFLTVMRCHLQGEHSDLRALFAQFDVELKGSLTGRQLGQLFRQLGYTIQQEVIQESIKELGPATTVMGVIFEDVCRLLTTIRQREGFSKSERDELLVVYKQNDKEGRGELREFELAHAVNYLGYPLSHARRQALWCKVDVDKNNSIDESEFLKLVRLLREEETAAVQAMLETCAGRGRPREKDIKDMLGRLGYKLSQAMFADALKQNMDSSGGGEADLWGTLSMLRFIRKQLVDELRQTCGLQQDMAERIQKRHKTKLDAGKRVEASDFEKYMYELFREARSSPEERGKIKAIVEDHCEDGTLGLKDMFWVVRLYGDALEEGKLAKEKDASQLMGFSEQQVAQFKQAFVEADSDDSGQLSEEEIRRLLEDVADLTPSQASLLNVELSNLDRSNISFSEFLRILGKILSDEDD